jgi:hypothetical protein
MEGSVNAFHFADPFIRGLQSAQSREATFFTHIEALKRQNLKEIFFTFNVRLASSARPQAEDSIIASTR